MKDSTRSVSSAVHSFHRFVAVVLIPVLIMSQTTGCSRKTLREQTEELLKPLMEKAVNDQAASIKQHGLVAIPPVLLTNHTPVSAYQEFLKAFKERTGEDWEQAAKRYHTNNQTLAYKLKEVSFKPPKGEKQVLAGLDQLATRVPAETRQKVLAVRNELETVSTNLSKLQTVASGYRDRYLPVASEIDRLCSDVEKLKAITDPAVVKSSVEATLNQFVKGEALKKLDEFRQEEAAIKKLVPGIKSELENLKKVWQKIEDLKKGGLKNAPELQKAQEFLKDYQSKMEDAAQAISLMAMSAKFMVETLIALGIAPHVAVFIFIVLAILALFQSGSGGGGDAGKAKGGGGGQPPGGGKGMEPQHNPKLADPKAEEGMLGTERPGFENEGGNKSQKTLPQGKHYVPQITVESIPDGVTPIPYSDGAAFGFQLEHKGVTVDLNLDPKAPGVPGANSARVIQAISDCITGLRNLKMVGAHVDSKGESFVDLEGVEDGQRVRVLKKPGDPFALTSMVNTSQ